MTYRTFTQALEQGAVKFVEVDFSGYDKEDVIGILELAKDYLNSKIWVCHAITAAENFKQKKLGLWKSINAALPENYTVVDTEEFEATFGADYEKVCKKEEDVDEAHTYRLGLTT